MLCHHLIVIQAVIYDMHLVFDVDVSVDDHALSGVDASEFSIAPNAPKTHRKVRCQENE